MSNPSLKEQLQALSIDPLTQTNQIKSPKSSRENPKKNKPDWLVQAQYGVELLKAYFPVCFKENKDIQPLKVGIKQDLVKHLSSVDNITMTDKACMVTSLSYYVNSLAYHKTVVEGAARIGLEGHEAGTVTKEEAQYSTEYRQNKLQKNKTLVTN